MLTSISFDYFIYLIHSLSNSRRHSANADVIADVKSKIIVHVSIFLPTWFFLPLQKFKTIQISIPKQVRAHYMFQGILKTFLNIYALLFIFRKL